ncbi:MAG: protein-L-isoaspartate O-methyltransferase [Candidatus Hydrothermarchaeota archaeon]|jgi:protein-L-isoaspartate(D-aspartate) O-methyltransferase|nr:protein-L-isoaspartate O-methyltransferase [Candidatus Hydrothermarchaeota archaeon]
MYEEERIEMVERLAAFGYLRSEKVAEAMRKVPRHLFVPEDLEANAYEDRPLPVGEEQTISAPHMVAMMCDALELREDHKVLEVGAGTGYHACIVAHIVKKGSVFAVERIARLAEKAKENMEKAGCEQVQIIIGDGTRGHEKEAPYDRIFVTAGAPDIPKPLVEQLKVGGKLLIPIGSRYMQELILIEKTENKIEKRNLGSCVFVPLIGEYGW